MPTSPSSALRGLGSVSRNTLREQILTRLRDAVSSGELAPGTHLGEIELADSLGVSRGTLREALRHLQQEGLLAADSRGRLSVRVVSAADIREIFDVRYALESLACEEICAFADRSDAVVVLRERLDALNAAEEFAARVRADLAFHETLCELSGNATLLQSWQRVAGLARAALTSGGLDVAVANMSIDRHMPLVDILTEGDPDAARRFLREHMDAAVERLLDRVEA